MIRALFCVLALLAPGAAQAQIVFGQTTEETQGPQEDSTITEEAIEETRLQAAIGTGAVLRGLDKVSGVVIDLEVPTGATGQIFGLDVGVSECRYPDGNPAGDAYAYLVIRVPGVEGAIFNGMALASAPALNALDHARYDVWVLRCITS
ncbi:MAG: DUF2155 domain-containing protein [Proteobacteria bacterium]|nr:DUF2155 domain-containing protein [Pseudomonadota bacterium]